MYIQHTLRKCEYIGKVLFKDILFLYAGQTYCRLQPDAWVHSLALPATRLRHPGANIIKHQQTT
jgi:hypothetical protein